MKMIPCMCSETVSYKIQKHWILDIERNMTHDYYEAYLRHDSYDMKMLLCKRNYDRSIPSDLFVSDFTEMVIGNISMYTKLFVERMK